MKIKLPKLDNLINPWRSKSFIYSIEEFLNNEGLNIIEKYFVNEDVEVINLSKGSVGVVFLLTNHSKELVLKLVEVNNEFNHYWAEQVGYSFSSKQGVNIPKMLAAGKSNKYNFYYELIEKVDFIPLPKFLDINSNDKSWVYDTALNLSKLHKVIVNGYGEFEEETFNVKNNGITQRDYILNDRLEPSLMNYFIDTKLLKVTEVKMLYERAQALNFDNTNSIIHGDFYIDNLFYDTKNSKVILFDFKSSAADRLFDLGRMRHSLIGQGLSEHWIEFKNEYRQYFPFDEERLNTFSLITMLRDLKGAHKEENLLRFNRLMSEFRSMM